MSNLNEGPHVHLPCHAQDAHRAIDRWEFEDRALEEFDKLADEAKDAYDFLYAKLRMWAETGAKNVPLEVLEIPVARSLQVNVKNPPLIGEIKATHQVPGKEKKFKHYRLYFSDIASAPEAPRRQMLIGLTSEKLIKKTRLLTNRAQNKQMADAMFKIKTWCEKRDLQYRKRG